MGYISVRNAHKEFMKDGEPLTILEDINLDIEKGEFICLLGPSGSGKSTLLNAIAGFELVTSGSITIDGEEVKAPQLRYVTVFQNYGLLPWRTVESNIGLGLESKKVPKEERPAIIDKYVKMVGSQTGLGFLIIDMRNNLRNDLLMVAILTIGFVGLLLDWGVSLIEKWIYKRWGIEK